MVKKIKNHNFRIFLPAVIAQFIQKIFFTPMISYHYDTSFTLVLEFFMNFSIYKNFSKFTTDAF